MLYSQIKYYNDDFSKPFFGSNYFCHLEKPFNNFYILV